jgi:hypothetical protein
VASAGVVLGLPGAFFGPIHSHAGGQSSPADALQSNSVVVRQSVFSGRGRPESFSPSKRLQRQTHCAITSRQRYSMDSETQKRISREHRAARGSRFSATYASRAR